MIATEGRSFVLLGDELLLMRIAELEELRL